MIIPSTWHEVLTDQFLWQNHLATNTEIYSALRYFINEFMHIVLEISCLGGTYECSMINIKNYYYWEPQNFNGYEKLTFLFILKFSKNLSITLALI